jgi:hypothetical protein
MRVSKPVPNVNAESFRIKNDNVILGINIVITATYRFRRDTGISLIKHKEAMLKM